MFDSNRGSVSRLVLGGLIILAFIFALIWPQYAKRRDTRRAQQAGEFARLLAFAEETYKQQNGSYTPDFRLLEVTLECPLLQTADGPVLDCPEYAYSLQQNAFIRAEHKHLSVWLEVSLAGQTLSCKHPPEDWAGTDLCNRLARI